MRRLALFARAGLGDGVEFGGAQHFEPLRNSCGLDRGAHARPAHAPGLDGRGWRDKVQGHVDVLKPQLERGGRSGRRRGGELRGQPAHGGERGERQRGEGAGGVDPCAAVLAVRPGMGKDGRCHVSRWLSPMTRARNMPPPIAEEWPVVCLVRPQMGENIGAVARVMLNFGLTSLRLVAPRDRWPNPKAEVVAVGADEVLKRAKVEWKLEDAL